MHRVSRLTFLELAASPQIFHVATRSAPAFLGGNCMCTGSTLLVGWPFALVSELSATLAFFLGLESSSDSSGDGEAADLRLDEEAARLAAGRATVSSSSRSGFFEEDEAARFGGMIWRDMRKSMRVLRYGYSL